MDVIIPGVDPWDEVLRNPYIWHFALHSIPHLPKRSYRESIGLLRLLLQRALVDATKITPEARAAYSTPSA
jgi:hypothetical protein